MVTLLYNLDCGNRQRKSFEGPCDFSDWSLKRLEKHKRLVNENPEFLAQISEFNDLSRPLLFDRSQIILNEPEKTATLPSTYLLNRKV